MCYNINEDILPLYGMILIARLWKDGFTWENTFPFVHYVQIYCIRYLITQHVHQKITYIKARLMYVRGWNMKVSFRIKQENEKDLCSNCKLRERQPIMTCY